MCWGGVSSFFHVDGREDFATSNFFLSICSLHPFSCCPFFVAKRPDVRVGGGLVTPAKSGICSVVLLIDPIFLPTIDPFSINGLTTQPSQDGSLLTNAQ